MFKNALKFFLLLSVLFIGLLIFKPFALIALITGFFLTSLIPLLGLALLGSGVYLTFKKYQEFDSNHKKVQNITRNRTIGPSFHQFDKERELLEKTLKNFGGSHSKSIQPVIDKLAGLQKGFIEDCHRFVFLESEFKNRAEEEMESLKIRILEFPEKFEKINDLIVKSSVEKSEESEDREIALKEVEFYLEEQFATSSLLDGETPKGPSQKKGKGLDSVKSFSV